MEAEHEAEQGVGLLLRVALAVREAVGQVRMEVREEEDGGDGCLGLGLGLVRVGEEEDRGDGCATPTTRSVRGGAGGWTGAGAGAGAAAAAAAGRGGVVVGG